MSETLDKLFGAMPTRSVAEPFNHEKAFGIVVNFSEQGFGFGQVSFAVDKATSKATFDDEDMRLEHCAEIIARIATPESAVLSRIEAAMAKWSARDWDDLLAATTKQTSASELVFDQQAFVMATIKRALSAAGQP